MALRTKVDAINDMRRQLRERQTAVNIENSDRETTDPHADPPFLVDPTRLYSPDGHTVDGKWLMTVAKMNDVKGRHLDPASVHAAFGDQFMRTLVNDENFDEQDAIEELQEADRSGARPRRESSVGARNTVWTCSATLSGPDGVTPLLMNSSVRFAMLLISW